MSGRDDANSASSSANSWAPAPGYGSNKSASTPSPTAPITISGFTSTPERAKAESPFGGPIAHGYLTLSLIISMWAQVLQVESVTTAINYGLNKVRCTSPVPAGGRVRLNATLKQYEEPPKGGVQVTIDDVIELEGSERAAVIVEAIYRTFE